jgi:hypothetical protein
MKRHQYSSDDNRITIELDRNEALVLFDLIARWQWDNNCANIMNIDHDTEKHVLLNIATWLNDELDEPTLPDYETRLQEAKKIITKSWKL